MKHNSWLFFETVNGITDNILLLPLGINQSSLVFNRSLGLYSCWSYCHYV